MNTEWSDRLEQFQNTLTRSELDLLNYVNTNPEQAVMLSQRDLSATSGVSKPLIINFFRKLGYADYHSFQESVEAFFSTHIDSFRASQDLDKRVSSIDDLVEQAVEVDLRSLRRMRESIPEQFLTRFAGYVQENNEFFVSGAGTGRYPAHYISTRLRRYRVHSYLLSQDAAHLVDEVFPVGKDSVLLVFHYSDTDAYLLPLLRFARERGAIGILASGTIHPDYVGASDWFIHVPRGELGFKNSMATPMAFANLLLLAVEVTLGAPLRSRLKELEDTRRNWGQLSRQGGNDA